MAKLNMIIRAFEADELTMLNDIFARREKQAIEEGYILPDPFQSLKDNIYLASKYASGARRIA